MVIKTHAASLIEIGVTAEISDTVFSLRLAEMKTSEVLQKIDIPRHKLYYLEQKGYVVPKRIPMGDLEAREYWPQDAAEVRLIWKYLKKGFKHRAAYRCEGRKSLETMVGDLVLLPL